MEMLFCGFLRPWIILDFALSEISALHNVNVILKIKSEIFFISMYLNFIYEKVILQYEIAFNLIILTDKLTTVTQI